MLIFPELLFRRSIRRASVSLCFFNLNTPGVNVVRLREAMYHDTYRILTQPNPLLPSHLPFSA